MVLLAAAPGTIGAAAPAAKSAEIAKSPDVPGPISLATLRASLGKNAQVFPVDGGEAVIGLPFLKRIEVTADTALFTVRNDTRVAIAPTMTVDFFNAYGMRLATVAPSFESDPVPAGGVSAQRFRLMLPNLEGVFATSSWKLPGDWKTMRFVQVRLNVPRVQTVEVDPPKNPPSRPQLFGPQPTRPAILGEGKFGTANIGPVGMDARWNNYGAYLQRMIDTVQSQWESALSQEQINPAIGTTVSVKFAMNDEGRITMIAPTGSSTASEAATRACVNAIKSRAPYGPWTADMKAALGHQQELTFTFSFR